jgi:NADPH-dependent curcumin reductase CurA
MTQARGPLRAVTVPCDGLVDELGCDACIDHKCEDLASDVVEEDVDSIRCQLAQPGIENLGATLLKLFDGSHTGKLLLKVSA